MLSVDPKDFSLCIKTILYVAKYVCSEVLDLLIYKDFMF